MIVKHLYQRSIKKNGKIEKVWYFWFWKDGKQIRRSCGTTVKRVAMAYIESLSDGDLMGTTGNASVVTLRDFSAGMFDKDSSYLVKLKNKGTEFTEQTLKSKRLYLNHILSRFGDYDPKKISVGIIDDWLLRQKKSNSWRNNVLSVFRAIYSELYVYQMIDRIPDFIQYKRIDTKVKGILSPEEIKRLFPNNTDKLISVWRIWKYETDLQSMIFAVMIYTALTTGMRSGEIRALTYSQFIQENAVLLNAMLDRNGKRIQHLKKGDERNKKWRVAILPERTVEMIRIMRLMEGEKESEYVFEYNGKPFSGEYFNYHFRDVLKKNGIDVRERNITAHSLRFTYNSMMRREISADDLRLMLGHSSAIMTDYYDKSRPLDHLPELLENKAIIDSVWN